MHKTTMSYYLKFDIKVIKLANSIDQVSDEKLFIRYYIPALRNRRIHVDTKGIKSKKDVVWSEPASFECHVNSDQIHRLELSHFTFELRSKRTRPIVGSIMTRSRLLGVGEISLKDVMDSMGMGQEKWVNFDAKCGELDGFNLPNLLVELKVKATSDADLNEERKCRSGKNCDLIGAESADIDMYHVETLVD